MGYNEGCNTLDAFGLLAFWLCLDLPCIFDVLFYRLSITLTHQDAGQIQPQQTCKQTNSIKGHRLSTRPQESTEVGDDANQKAQMAECTSPTLANLLRMQPIGMVSKELIGARHTHTRVL